MLNNIDDEGLTPRLRRQVLIDAVPFLVLFLAFAAHLLTADGFAVNPETGIVSIEAYKYLHNFLALPLTLVLFLLGVVLVLLGIGRTVSPRRVAASGVRASVASSPFGRSCKWLRSTTRPTTPRWPTCKAHSPWPTAARASSLSRP